MSDSNAAARRVLRISEREAVREEKTQSELQLYVQKRVSEMLGFPLRLVRVPGDGACFSHCLHTWFVNLPQEERRLVQNADALLPAASIWTPRHWAHSFASYWEEHLRSGAEMSRMFVGHFDREVYLRALKLYRKHWCAYNTCEVLVDPANPDSVRYSIFDDMPFLTQAFHNISVVLNNDYGGNMHLLTIATRPALTSPYIILGRYKTASGAYHYDLLVPEGMRALPLALSARHTTMSVTPLLLWPR